MGQSLPAFRQANTFTNPSQWLTPNPRSRSQLRRLPLHLRRSPRRLPPPRLRPPPPKPPPRLKLRPRRAKKAKRRRQRPLLKSPPTSSLGHRLFIPSSKFLLF